MNKRSLLILEIIWITVGIVCLATGTQYAITSGGSRVFVFVLMAVVSFTFAFMRHRQRKKS